MQPLSTQLGIRLVLWMGPVIPLPPPEALLASLAATEVTIDASGQDGFQLTFRLGRHDGPLALARRTLLGAGSRVVIAVVIGLLPQVLINGVVTHHQMVPSNDPGQSTLTVIGRDVGALMDLEERSEIHPNQPDWVIATKLMVRNQLVPSVVPTPDVPLALLRIPSQTQTDLEYLRTLARRNAYVFYVEPVAFGVSRGYFGPELRVGLPQPALSMNMGGGSNVDELTFKNDFLATAMPAGSYLEPYSGQVVPVPPLPTPRWLPPLSAMPQVPQRTTQLRALSHLLVSDVARAPLAEHMSQPEPVRGEGVLDTLRYGAVLQARRLVGVRGVGQEYDGNYYVERVTHVLKGEQYQQKFAIRRDGTGAQLPVVVP